jgi:hypothetical protein
VHLLRGTEKHRDEELILSFFFLLPCLIIMIFPMLSNRCPFYGFFVCCPPRLVFFFPFHYSCIARTHYTRKLHSLHFLHFVPFCNYVTAGVTGVGRNHICGRTHTHFFLFPPLNNCQARKNNFFFFGSSESIAQVAVKSSLRAILRDIS